LRIRIGRNRSGQDEQILERTQQPQGKAMSQSKGHAKEQTVRFHRIVTEGGVDELQAALMNGADANAPAMLE
jgi:hypothetical protein